MKTPVMDANAFGWVDDYFAHVSRHFEIREEDQLLIVMPNRAVKINPSALAILRHLKGGGSVAGLLGRIGADEGRRRELFHFLCDFRSLVSGCLGEGGGRKAVSIGPHPKVFNVLPVLSEVALTYRCNLRCRFCYAGCGCRGPDRADAAEMSTREVVRVLEIIRRVAKAPSVSFTGGEPLLRADIVDLVSRAVTIGLRVNLITNATLLARGLLASRLRAAGLASAQVSLEGPTAEVHEALSGVPGSFEATLAGLAALREARIHVHTNTTINAVNAPYLVELVRRVAGLGLARLSMNMVIPAGAAEDASLQIPYRRIGAIVDEVRRAAREAGVEFMWYSPTPMCMFNPLAAGLGNKSCAACDGLLSVSPTGDVLPCSSYPEPVGNLLRQPFAAIWDAARARFFRAKSYAPAQCAGCEDFAACAGACPLYWSAMGTGELTEVRRAAHAVA
jgi:radical SAM protein with 4Fe4S-binding SPASM domain